MNSCRMHREKVRIFQEGKEQEQRNFSSEPCVQAKNIALRVAYGAKHTWQDAVKENVKKLT